MLHRLSPADRTRAIATIVVAASILTLVALAYMQPNPSTTPTASDTSNQTSTTIQSITGKSDLEAARQQVDQTNLNFMDESELLQIEAELL